MPPLASHSRLKHAQHVLSKPILEESVVLHLSTGHYYSLNLTATRLWNFFAESHTVEDAIRWLAAECALPQDKVRTDVERYLKELLEEKLLEAL